MNFVTLDLSTTPGVADIRLNRPERLNALTREMLIELGDCFGELVERGDTKIAVLSGVGRAFAAGVDLRELDVDNELLKQGDVGPNVNDPAQHLIDLIETAPFPVIAKVHGACFTGALEIALACDWIVASENTKFGDTHAKLGLRPTWGMTVRLCEAVGPRRARELSYTSRTFSGIEALDYGLVTVAVPADQLDQAVADQCQAVLKNSPSSMRAYKSLYLQGLGAGRAAALEAEGLTRFDCLDAPERVDAFVATLEGG